MQWAFGTHVSIPTVAVGCAVVAVCAMIITRPKIMPLSLPQISFTAGAAARTAKASSITITSADAAHAMSIVTSTDDVHSQADLVAYADGLMKADSRIDEITFGDHSISMTYETANRILNVKSVSDRTQVTIAEDGTITLTGSWYRPLFSHVAQASSPNAGFSDIKFAQDASGLTPETEARLLSRLSGRFRIGAIR